MRIKKYDSIKEMKARDIRFNFKYVYVHLFLDAADVYSLQVICLVAI